MISDKNKNFCPAPWLSLHVDPSGRVDNCCVAKNDIGDLNHAAIDTIVVGEKNQNIQQLMLQDQPVAGCAWCQGTEHNLQQHLFRIFPDRGDPLYDKPGAFQARYLDLRWSNTCNFACVYCGPVYSSLHAQEQKNHIRIERDTKNQLLDFVLSRVSEIRHLYLAGGEPLMMKENEILLRALKQHNPDVEIVINTNLSDLDSNTIYRDLLEFPSSRFMVSVDDRFDRYEYIRWPGQWQTFSQNLQRLQQDRPLDRISFNLVVMNINAVSVWNLVDWLLQQGFSAQSITTQLYNNGVADGPWSMHYLPSKLVSQSLDRMADTRYHDCVGWSNIQEHLATVVQRDDAMLFQHLEHYDKLRLLDSRKIFPEIYHHRGQS